MAVICSPGPFPTYSQIRSSVDGLFQLIQSTASFSISQVQEISIKPPDTNIVLPPMPGMPQIAWPSTASPGLELEMFANQLQSFQLLSVMSSAYQVLSSVVSLPLPSIPGIPGATLDTLLQLNPEVLLANISPISIPGLYQDLEWPEMEILSSLQILIGEYQDIMINFLFGLANEVADILEVSSLASLPQIPNAQDILNQIPRGLSFSGFSIDLSVPDPLIPGFDFPEYEKGQILKMVVNSLPTELLQTIVEFIDDTLPGLSVPVVPVCLPVNLESSV